MEVVIYSKEPIFDAELKEFYKEIKSCTERTCRMAFASYELVGGEYHLYFTSFQDSEFLPIVDAFFVLSLVKDRLVKNVFDHNECNIEVK